MVEQNEIRRGNPNILTWGKISKRAAQMLGIDLDDDLFSKIEEVQEVEAEGIKYYTVTLTSSSELNESSVSMTQYRLNTSTLWNSGVPKRILVKSCRIEKKVRDRDAAIQADLYNYTNIVSGSHFYPRIRSEIRIETDGTVIPQGSLSSNEQGRVGKLFKLPTY